MTLFKPIQSILIACICGLFLTTTSCLAASKQSDDSPGDSRSQTTTVSNHYSDIKNHIRETIQEVMAERDITGLSIALVDDQEIVWAEGFGWADKRNRIKATPETVYRAGSIAKVFTAIAVMQLAEKGAIDIDQPLQKYLPRFSMRNRFPDAGPVTPRNIMTHHAGLPTALLRGMWMRSTGGEHFTQVVDKIRDIDPAFPPDLIYVYQNLGITLLGHMVQEVDGRPYEQYIVDMLFEPMGMNHSYMASTLREEARSSKSYIEHAEVPDPPLRDVPTGGLQTTVLDMGRFAHMLFADGRAGHHRLLKPETLREMFRPQDIGVLDFGRQIGLGWDLKVLADERAGVIASKSGGTPLFHSAFYTLPKHRLAVIAMSNSMTSDGVVQLIARQTLTSALKNKIGIVVSDKQEKPAHHRSVESGQSLSLPGSYAAGIHAGMANNVVRIFKKGDRLKIKLDGDTLNLVLRDDGRYYPQYKLLGLIPIDLDGFEKMGLSRARIAGRDVLLIHVAGDDHVFAERIPSAPIPPAWQRRLGKYEVDNPESDRIALSGVRLYKKEGLFLMDFRYNMLFEFIDDDEDDEPITKVVVPLTDTEAVIHGLGTGNGYVLRIVSQGDQEWLHFSGYLLHRSEAL